MFDVWQGFAKFGLLNQNPSLPAAMSLITDYHAKYYAWELGKRHPIDSTEKFAGAVANAEVDLNPYQVEAAFFAFRSPSSKVAKLADEVGLGKMTESGFELEQNYAVWCHDGMRALIGTGYVNFNL